MKEGHASRTAVLVCKGRALADGRVATHNGAFADPTALALLRDDERDEVTRAAAAPEPPRGMQPRIAWEMLHANAEVMAPRTLAIDEAVRTAVADGHGAQLVLLGAGLDGRAYRMDALREAVVFEVDHPDSQADKRARMAAAAARGAPLTQKAREVRFVAVDFARDSLAAALAAAGHDAAAPTAWLWEGVVPYLTPDEVEATLDVVAGRSAPGSRIVVGYLAPGLKQALGRMLAAALGRLGSAQNPLEHEPQRSFYTADKMREALARHGFRVITDENLDAAAARFGVALTRRSSTAVGRIAVAAR